MGNDNVDSLQEGGFIRRILKTVAVDGIFCL